MTSDAKRLLQQLNHTYHQLDGVFTDREAWGLFKTAAILETVGWTLLIIGIVFDEFRWPQYDNVLAVAGSIHGLLFIFYIFIVFFAHRSLGWSFWRMLVGEAVSVVPYGALVFEQWAAYMRRKQPTQAAIQEVEE